MNRSCCISMIHRKKYSHWLIFQLNHLLCYLFSISLWICITVMHLNCYRSLLTSKSHKVPTSKIWDFFAFCVKIRILCFSLDIFFKEAQRIRCLRKHLDSSKDNRLILLLFNLFNLKSIMPFFFFFNISYNVSLSHEDSHHYQVHPKNA